MHSSFYATGWSFVSVMYQFSNTDLHIKTRTHHSKSSFVSSDVDPALGRKGVGTCGALSSGRQLQSLLPPTGKLATHCVQKNFILGETQEITWNASLSPHFALRVSRGSVMDCTLRLPLISDVAKWDLSKDEAFTEMKIVFNLRRGRDLMSLCVSIIPTYVPTHIFYQFLYALYSQKIWQLLEKIFSNQFWAFIYYY